ncbi:hypothetical protein ATO13_08571 [Stappia sp. 22II-S9-Z10]|nr:hypothetical protein ATO13_08571 [Stappia sp. 22II-S9-Z10]
MMRVTSNSAKVRQGVRNLVSSQVPFATALALTAAAKDARTAVRKEMRSVFDQPTPYTLSSLQVTPADKRDLTAVLWFKDYDRGINHYLVPQVSGGPRPAKLFERRLASAGLITGSQRLVPARSYPRDRYGNMPRAVYQRILSNIQAQGDAYQNTTAKSRKRNRKRAQYFFAGADTGLTPGVYERKFGDRDIKAVFVVTDGTNYSVRLRFKPVARATIERTLPRHFYRAMRKAIATAR